MMVLVVELLLRLLLLRYRQVVLLQRYVLACRLLLHLLHLLQALMALMALIVIMTSLQCMTHTDIGNARDLVRVLL